MEGNGRLPLEGGLNHYINEYPFLQHPTTANEHQWAAATAPTISGDQAAALIHHTRNHATGITRSLEEQGVTPTRAQNQVQVHLAFLRDSFDNGQWHHPLYPPTQAPPPLDVLTPLVTMTRLGRLHAPGRPPYEILWGDAPFGFVLQAIQAVPRGRLTRATASDALHRFRLFFQLPIPLRRRKEPLAVVDHSPDPEVPRGSGTNQPQGDFSRLSGVSLSPTASPEPNEKKDPASSSSRRRTPSPPPMPSDGHESDVSVEGAVANLFAQPGLPLEPHSRKFKALRASALVAHAKEEKKRDAAEVRRLSREKKKGAAIAAEGEGQEEGEGEEDGDNGISLEQQEEMVDDIAAAAARAASRTAKRKWGHLLPPARRGVITRRVKNKAKEAVRLTIE